MRDIRESPSTFKVINKVRLFGGSPCFWMSVMKVHYLSKVSLFLFISSATDVRCLWGKHLRNPDSRFTLGLQRLKNKTEAEIEPHLPGTGSDTRSSVRDLLIPLGVFGRANVPLRSLRKVSTFHDGRGGLFTPFGSAPLHRTTSRCLVGERIGTRGCLSGLRSL